ncbi:MAG: hypothetical protein A2W99_07295 [Bacteroidetes bacterium GWF2_33_16]|nr:MAG: hypothetical protein A2X00_12075 [Bacteroidetes bacterium GWE2_32_14]OFY03195.1 MAG: hypothetical protein A2W99_07295 [Bacteroidetes bacterium GWF2_33_16]
MKYIKYILILVLLAGMFSCELPDNTNPKEPAIVPETALFTNAQIAVINQINEMNQNLNISRLLAQYNAQTTYYGESQWNFYDRGLPDAMWEELYRDVLVDFKEARQLISENNATPQANKDAQLAQIDVLEVLAYHVLVDVNGDVPYTDALNGRDNPTPAYDDAADIYYDLIDRLTADAAVFAIGEGGFTNVDVLYFGDMDLWFKFANSLKLRLAMRIADYDAASSQSFAEEAITDGVFADQSESALLYYTGTTPHVNTIFAQMVEAGRRDFVASNTIVDTMNAINDPRRPFYFTTVGGIFKGGRYGYRNVYNQCSSFPARMRDADYPATIIDFVEVKFLIAEAAARGYAVGGGTVETHYNEAITESILAWGGTNADATAYLAEPVVGYNTGTTAGLYKRKIGLQKWLALYDRGLEGWASWRIFDSPTMNIARYKTIDDIPMRMPYPYNEDNLNLENYTAASAAIGGDEVSTPIFWDMFDINGNPR